jgi:hypothetical protein
MLKPLSALRPLADLKPLIPIDEPPSTLGEPEGNNEEIALTDHQKMMKMLREQQQAAIDAANDTSYWFAVYFQNTQQKDEFIAALKLTTGGQYVDGLELAERCKVPVTPRAIKYKTGKIDRKLNEIAR